MYVILDKYEVIGFLEAYQTTLVLSALPLLCCCSSPFQVGTLPPYFSLSLFVSSVISISQGPPTPVVLSYFAVCFFFSDSYVSILTSEDLNGR